MTRLALLAALLAALLVGACAARVPAAVAEPAAPADAEATVFVSEGGMLRPLANGGRVALRDGWAEVRFTPYPLGPRSDLDVRIIDGRSGRAADADVTVLYEMLGMEHGMVVQRATPRSDGHHTAPLNVAMPGQWRFMLRIARSGEVESVVLVLPVAP